MQERGIIIRRDIPRWMETNRVVLASAIGRPVADFLSEGSDGKGAKARIPWTRFGSHVLSPKPTSGFFVVYVWAFPGGSAYLCLLQGTHDHYDGELIRKPHKLLRSHVDWARDVLSSWLAARDDFVELRLGNLPETSLARGYELGNIASIRYRMGDVPGESALLSDARSFGEALGTLYRANISR